jgi:creatinine amidohydrolase
MKHQGKPLADSTWREVRDQPRPPVAVLPWGATEAHNYHLPYGTDVIQVSAIAAEAGRLAAESGCPVTVLPTVPFGVQTGQLDIPFCLNMNPSTQAALLADLVAPMPAWGVRSLVVLNGHGGNDFRAIVRELQPRTPVFLCVIDWWKVAPTAPLFADPGDHAGDLETSVMMRLAPSLVRPLTEAGPGSERKRAGSGFREGWAWAPRKWTEATADTGVGNPAAATAAKGDACFREVTRKVASFLAELTRGEAGPFRAD